MIKATMVSALAGSGFTAILFQVMPDSVNGILWWIIGGLVSVIITLATYIKSLWNKLDESQKEKITILKDTVEASNAGLYESASALKEFGNAQKSTQLMQDILAEVRGK